MKPGSEEAHRTATLMHALYGPSARETINQLSNGAQTLLGQVEKLSQSRDPAIADQIAQQCDGLRRTAHRARMALMAETTGDKDDAA